MNNKILASVFLVALIALSIVRAEKPKFPSDFTVYLVPVDLMTNRRLGAADAMASAYRTVKINRTKEDACVNAWSKIDKISDFSGKRDPADIRVVVIVDGKTYAFDGDADFGTLNERPVSYTAQTKAWFSKFILPMNSGNQ